MAPKQKSLDFFIDFRLTRFGTMVRRRTEKYPRDTRLSLFCLRITAKTAFDPNSAHFTSSEAFDS